MDASLYDQFYRVERTHWWSVGMRRVFHMMAARAIAGRNRARLLDVGCGTGITLEEFARYGPIVGVDRAWPAVAYSKARNAAAAVVQADMLQLPVAGESVDVVLAFDVIEHLDDDGAAIREMRRVLVEHGILLVNVPAFMSLWCEKDTLNHHKRRYTKDALHSVLEENGFNVERLTYTNAALFPFVWGIRQVQRRTRRRWNPEAEYHPKALVNRLLTAHLGVECRVLEHFDLPFGTSVTCVARKRG